MTVREELLTIHANNGICNPVAVVEFARNPETALHSKFEWDDTIAAENHRLWQARQIISLELTVIQTDKKQIETRLFVSLSNDRKPNGGYRLITDVLNDPGLRNQLIDEALQEFNKIKIKYGHLKELATVFRAIDKLG